MAEYTLPRSNNRKRYNFHIDNSVFSKSKLLCGNSDLSVAALVEYLLTTVNKKTVESAKKYLAKLV